MVKKLTKSRDNKKVEGVCAGIANYFNLDPTLVRVVCALVIVSTGVIPGVILYIICAVIMPPDDNFIDYGNNNGN